MNPHHAPGRIFSIQLDADYIIRRNASYDPLLLFGIVQIVKCIGNCSRTRDVDLRMLLFINILIKLKSLLFQIKRQLERLMFDLDTLLVNGEYLRYIKLEICYPIF